MAELPKIGKLAPNFALPNQEGQKISLKDYKGEKNVVIYFYPKAMTPGCTVQACSIRDVKAELKKLQTVVLGISPDSVEKLVKFQEKEGLNFDLLADVDHKVAELYGAWGMKKLYGKSYMGVLRNSYIVGKDGKIKHIIEKANTKTHHEDIIEFIREHLC